MLKKLKIWKTSTADKKLKELVKLRDKYICQRCHRDFSDNKKLYHCSHFWGENNSGTRFEMDNCIGLCYNCHYGDIKNGWEHNKQGEYMTFMIKWLGLKRYNELKKLAYSNVKRSEAIKQFKLNYNDLRQKLLSVKTPTVN